MLSVSPLRSSNCDEREEHVGGFPTTASDDFSDDYSGGSTLLEDIDFDDLFVGFDDGDVLPDLELDPAEILAEFSVGSEEQEAATHLTVDHDQVVQEAKPREAKNLISSDDARSKSREKDRPAKSPTTSSSSSEVIGGRKSSALSAKGSHGKRKLKVDWTPELHRRFVQAVEQLGVDKAVPSRILELMGIDCLTRHNIASHLQKYRSHRKHMLAREAEAATWSQKRHIYAGGGAGLAKKEVNLHPWLPLPPSMGFPPTPITAFRPLHVWGHPTVDQSMLHMWPKHLVRSPPPPWIPQLPLPPDPSYWHQHYTRGHRERWVPNALTQGTPCFPQPARFQAPPVPGVPQPPMIRPNYGVPPSSNHSSTQIQLDSHQSKENIDAAIGDVLAKPWLPLPLGLKPPSLDSVLVELQRQGVSKIPPACA